MCIRDSIQPFKQGKRVTDDAHRLAMAKLAFAEVPRTEVSTLEIDRMRVSYTYDTLTALQKELPGKELFFITGTDAFLALDSWYKGIDLLEHFSFIVSIRPGYREAELDHKIGEYRARYGTNVIKLVSQMPDISATEIQMCIRDRRRRHQQDLLPERKPSGTGAECFQL